MMWWLQEPVPDGHGLLQDVGTSREFFDDKGGRAAAYSDAFACSRCSVLCMNSSWPSLFTRCAVQYCTVLMLVEVVLRLDVRRIAAGTFDTHLGSSSAYAGAK